MYQYVARALLIGAVLALVCLGFGAEAPRAAGGGAHVQGDVNCSGGVDATDALGILRSVAGLGTPAACLADAGDVNCDGAVNSIDSLRILRHVAALPNSTPDGCAAIGEPLAAGPNSFELIQAALDAGDIDAEEALTYRIFVTFGDARLPSEYRGDDAAIWDDPGTVAELVATFDRLSPATQELLAPFLIPPDAPGSWLQLRTGAVGRAGTMFIAIESSPRVKVWYRTDQLIYAPIAQGLADEVDATIWPTLTGLMGPPRPDVGRVPDGGDERIDIILTGTDMLATAFPAPGCKQTSGFVLMGLDYVDKYVLTHELMHVIEFGFDVASACMNPDYTWIAEATAQWGMDFVYPDDQTERGSRLRPTGAVRCFFDTPNSPLDYRNGCHEYGAYLFLLYLEHEHDKQFIRAIWNAFAGADTLAGIDSAISSLGGFTEVWPEFQRQNFNRDPRSDYRKDDRLDDAAAFEADEDVSLGGASRRTYVLRGDVNHLAAFFHRYEFNDSAIREVTFEHSLADEVTARVQALYRYEGEQDWHVDDWTPDEERTFCYDDPGVKKFADLVIIITNSELDISHVLASNPQPELEVKSICRLTGTATGHYLSERGDQGEYRNEWTVTADIEWVEDPDFFFGCNCRVFFPEGEIHWTWDWRHYDPPCHESESGTLPAGRPPPYESEQWLVLWEDPDNPDQYLYSGNGLVPVTFVSECLSDPPSEEQWQLSFFNIPNPDIFPAAAHARQSEAVGSSLVPFCDDRQWVIPRDLTTLVGECYDAGYAERLLKYEWNFRVPGPP